MSTTSTVQDLNRELARCINAEARCNPQSPYASKFVGIPKTSKLSTCAIREPNEGSPMATAEAMPLETLYEQDETAWLEAMSELIRLGRFNAVDYPNLAEYLTDMAARDRREVRSRLVVMLTHLLKWEHQPDKRSHSWRTTVLNQRQELVVLASRGVLRVHATAVLNEAYKDAVELAASETAMQREAFPLECPYSFDQLLVIELPANA
jgi:hypothetical protein